MVVPAIVGKPVTSASVRGNTHHSVSIYCEDGSSYYWWPCSGELEAISEPQRNELNGGDA